MRLVAKQERNLIIQEARQNANLIIKDAMEKSNRIEFQANMLRKNIIYFKTKLKANLEEQMRLVEEIEVIELENK